MEFLIGLDKQLLLFFNGSHSLFWDYFFTFFSGKIAWIPLAIFSIGVIAYTKKKESLWIFLFLILTIVASDQISHLIKHLIERPRPTREPSLQGFVQPVFGYLGGRFGFVSSHASNSFAFAVFTSLLFRQKLYSISIFLWAALNCFSRMYLGVHYPGDILGGVLLGVFLGCLCFYVLGKINPQKSHKLPVERFTSGGFSQKLLNLLSLFLVLTVIILLFLSAIYSYLV